MPHRCTNCGYVIPDESEDLFNGCQECQNESWEYLTEELEADNENIEDDSQREARTEFVGSDELPDGDIVEGLQNPVAGQQESEDASMDRSEHVKIEEIDKLREKLNSQYEGIEVRRKGHYKINLTELYRGQEHIIEIGDDGAYQVKKVEEIGS